uniref:VWFA domain-containing protein n=1 Tax=Candidatus Kentrum sp. MB TaxID=2138164 RepID=A0A450XM73_9GAMM|nr:MAG: hypothetical protein BECKMB1821G_GA0114241_10648 [Candidatus Kentron sp. MB]
MIDGLEISLSIERKIKMLKTETQCIFSITGKRLWFPLFLLVYCAGLGISMQSWAGPGDCQQFDFQPYYRHGVLSLAGYARVSRGNEPIYDAPTGGVITGHLPFNTVLSVQAEQGSRLQVARFGAKRSIGWVEKVHTLCRTFPLRGRNGIERKVFIRARTAPKGEKQPSIMARQRPEKGECLPNACRELTRFVLQLVFDEADGYLLLGNRYWLESENSNALLGWVSKDDVYQWPTAYALRPTETPPKNRRLCAYPTKADARAGTRCILAEGGPVWYTTGYRIPILAREGNLYKVAFPAYAGQGASRDSNQAKLSAVGFNNNDLRALTEKRYKDVFFLIDGTKSMQPAIDEVLGRGGKKGVVQGIMEKLRTDPEFHRSSRFRFGFRIYRDRYARGGNLGEGLPLDSPCAPNEDNQRENEQRFQAAITDVRVTTEDDDNYPENLYGGILQAVQRDMRSCPNHMKLLFVIGDAGYDAKAWGDQAIRQDQLIPRLRRETKAGTEQTLVFFIRTPDFANRVSRSETYKSAHALFRTQGIDLLIRLGLPRSFFMDERFQNIPRQVLKRLHRYGKVQINEIVLDMENGASFTESVRAMRQRYPDIEPAFWDILGNSVRKVLKDQYDNRVYDTVTQGYIPISDDFVEEVWLTAMELRNWKDTILAGFGDVLQYREDEIRGKFVETLINGLQMVVKRPVFQEAREIAAEYAQRQGGLPIRENSPLLSYQWEEYMDKTKVPICEISRLANWGYLVQKILSIVYDGRMRPVFEKAKYPQATCTGLSKKGKRIPWIKGMPRGKPLCPNDKRCRYDHPVLGRTIYWVPQEFLP